MFEADRSQAQVVSRSSEYAGGEVAFEGGVVGVRLAEMLGAVCVEFRRPVCNHR